MTAWDWPLALKPVEQTFFVEPVSARFAAALTGQVQVSARPADAWRAELTVRATPEAARALEAVLAGRHGSARLVLVPAFGRLTGTGTLASFDAYAAEIGATWFDDGSGFADDLVGTVGFAEGAGAPVVLGGCLHRLVLGGCRPFATGVLGVGDLVQTSPSRGHLIVADAVADADGLVVIPIAPRLRELPRRDRPAPTACAS